MFRGCFLEDAYAVCVVISLTFGGAGIKKEIKGLFFANIERQYILIFIKLLKRINAELKY